MYKGLEVREHLSLWGSQAFILSGSSSVRGWVLSNKGIEVHGETSGRWWRPQTPRLEVWVVAWHRAGVH